MKTERGILTEKQRNVLDFIRTYAEQHGEMPAVRGIADACGVLPQGVRQFLDALQAKGWVRYTKGGPGKPARIELLGDATPSKSVEAPKVTQPRSEPESAAGLTRRQAAFLASLEQHLVERGDVVSTSKLATALGIPKPNVTFYLATLEKRGVIRWRRKPRARTSTIEIVGRPSRPATEAKPAAERVASPAAQEPPPPLEAKATVPAAMAQRASLPDLIAALRTLLKAEVGEPLSRLLGALSERESRPVVTTSSQDRPASHHTPKPTPDGNTRLEALLWVRGVWLNTTNPTRFAELLAAEIERLNPQPSHLRRQG